MFKLNSLPLPSPLKGKTLAPLLGVAKVLIEGGHSVTLSFEALPPKAEKNADLKGGEK